MRLRPHHLLCVLTYGGAGYTPEFVENLDEVVARLSAGAELEVIEGADDICAPMLQCRDHPDFHCEAASVQERDRLALASLADLWQRLGLDPLVPGARLRLTPGLVDRMRMEFASGGIRAACAECEWYERCSARAGAGFEGAKLRPQSSSLPPPPTQDPSSARSPVPPANAPVSPAHSPVPPAHAPVPPTRSPVPPARPLVPPARPLVPPAPGFQLGRFYALDPAYKSVRRKEELFGVAVLGTILLIVVMAVWKTAAFGLPLFGWLAFLGMHTIYALVWPGIAYRHASYAVTEDGLVIVRGVLWRHRIHIPYSRIQHTDVAEGPIERLHRLAHVTVNTAGTSGASVDLPGLSRGAAQALRDHLVARVRGEDL